MTFSKLLNAYNSGAIECLTSAELEAAKLILKEEFAYLNELPESSSNDQQWDLLDRIETKVYQALAYRPTETA